MKIMLFLLLLPVLNFSQDDDIFPWQLHTKEINELEKRKQYRDTINKIDITNLSFEDGFKRIHRSLYMPEHLPSSRKKDPRDIFEYLVNPFEKKKILRIRTNFSVYANQRGIYQLNFEFTKNENDRLNPFVWDFSLKVFTLNRLMPFNLFGQKVEITAIGGEHIQPWKKDFYYDQRELFQDQTRNHLNRIVLLKYLNEEDLFVLKTLFLNSPEIQIEVKGLHGSYVLHFQEKQLAHYRHFFEFAKILKFY